MLRVVDCDQPGLQPHHLGQCQVIFDAGTGEASCFILAKPGLEDARRVSFAEAARTMLQALLVSLRDGQPELITEWGSWAQLEPGHYFTVIGEHWMEDPDAVLARWTAEASR